MPLLSTSTIKPLDTELLTEYAKKTGAVVTAEEHSVIGGLGAAVAEHLSEVCPTLVRKVGVNDTFGKSGPAAKVLEKYGLTVQNIYETAKKAVSEK